MSRLSAVKGLQIPRHVSFDEEGGGLQLHVFCDASERAYGCVAYLREDGEADTSPVMLLGSKTRVTSLPKKDMSIARKELFGALLGTKHGKKLLNVFDSLKLTVYLWTDSKIAIDWIKDDPYNLKQFVRNRTAIIRERFSPECWRHCPGKDNPADMASRGFDAQSRATGATSLVGRTPLVESTE